MRRVLFSFLSLALYPIPASAQNDTLIRVDGDTSFVHITEYGRNALKYQLGNVPSIQLSEETYSFQYIGFENPEIEDFNAPFHWKKRSGLFLGMGVRKSIVQESNESNFDIYQTLGIESYFARNWGFSTYLNYQAGWGGGEFFGHVEIGYNLLYREELNNPNWFFTSEVGLKYMLYHENPQLDGQVGIHFAPGISRKISDNIELGAQLNLDYYKATGLTFSPTMRLTIRW